jgi:hypothetical protein
MPNARKTIIAAVAAACFIGLVAGAYFGFQEYRLRQLKATVGAHLMDPFSAQYRDVAEKNGVICGEVNAKNQMGAYTGYKAFIHINGKTHFEDMTDMDSTNAEVRLKAIENRMKFLRLFIDNCPDEDPQPAQAASGAQRQPS